MKHLKLKINLPILLLVSIITCYLLVKDSFIDIKGTIFTTNIFIILIAIILLIISDLFKALSIYSISQKNKADLSFKEAFCLILETNFFNGVTPFALGGQPIQLYMLKKRNKIGYVTGTNIIFCDYYVYQITLIAYVTVLYILNKIFCFITLNTVMKIFLLVGFLIHFAIFVFLIYITYNKSKYSKLTAGIVHLLSKFKIIKDEEKTINIIQIKISKFKSLISEFRKDSKLVLKTSFYNFLKLTFYSIVPYLCFLAIGQEINIMSSIIVGVFVWCISSFIPIPGATGGMEYSFQAMFSLILTDSVVKTGTILWRFVSYYLFICLGAAIFIIINSKKIKTKPN